MITPSPIHPSLFNTTKTPMLPDAQTERALVIRAKAGDQTAIDKLVLAYMRLVVSLARPYGRNADPNDLINEGVIGLIRALDGFDPDAGYRFGTYARSWIAERLKEHTRNVRSLVGMGGGSERRRGLYHLGGAIDRETQEAYARGERTTQYQLLGRAAARVGVSISNAQDLVVRAGGDASLNINVAGMDSESLSWQDTLIDETADTEVQIHNRHGGAQRAALIHESMACLSPRERRIVLARHLADRPATLDALGREFGVSKERIRQVEKRALEKMASAIAHKRDEALSLV